MPHPGGKRTRTRTSQPPNLSISPLVNAPLRVAPECRVMRRGRCP